jgi:hypothetical protein
MWVARPRAPAIRAGWAALLLFAPGALLARATGRDPALLGTARTVLRVLGIRHLLTAVLLRGRPTRLVLAGAASADGLHAASALGLAAGDPRWRRAALLDAGVAVGFGLTTVGSLHRRRSRG